MTFIIWRNDLRNWREYNLSNKISYKIGIRIYQSLKNKRNGKALCKTSKSLFIIYLTYLRLNNKFKGFQLSILSLTILRMAVKGINKIIPATPIIIPPAIMATNIANVLTCN